MNWIYVQLLFEFIKYDHFTEQIVALKTILLKKNSSVKILCKMQQIYNSKPTEKLLN